MDVTDGHLSIAHCVSSDLCFGLGVARQIKEKFGQMELIRAQDCRVGRVAITCPDLPLLHPPRFIFHLFTKKYHFWKPSEASLEECLWELKHRMMVLGVHRIQAPRLACGLDRLKWERVLAILERVFCDSDFHICICTLPNSGSLWAHSTTPQSSVSHSIPKQSNVSAWFPGVVERWRKNFSTYPEHFSLRFDCSSNWHCINSARKTILNSKIKTIALWLPEKFPSFEWVSWIFFMSMLLPLLEPSRMT